MCEPVCVLLRWAQRALNGASALGMSFIGVPHNGIKGTNERFAVRYSFGKAR